MSNIVSHLEKVLSDLLSNRTKLKDQIEANTLQLSVNTEQLDHFDTLIASVRHNLSSNDHVAAIEVIKSTPPAEPVDPLNDAGAGTAADPAPAG